MSTHKPVAKKLKLNRRHMDLAGTVMSAEQNETSDNEVKAAWEEYHYKTLMGISAVRPALPYNEERLRQQLAAKATNGIGDQDKSATASGENDSTDAQDSETASSDIAAAGNKKRHAKPRKEREGKRKAVTGTEEASVKLWDMGDISQPQFALCVLCHGNFATGQDLNKHKVEMHGYKFGAMHLRDGINVTRFGPYGL